MTKKDESDAALRCRRARFQFSPYLQPFPPPPGSPESPRRVQQSLARVSRVASISRRAAGRRNRRCATRSFFGTLQGSHRFVAGRRLARVRAWLPRGRRYIDTSLGSSRCRADAREDVTRPETVFLASGFTRVYEGPMTHWLRRALRIGRDGDVVDFLVGGRRRFARGRARMISAAAGSGHFAARRGDV